MAGYQNHMLDDLSDSIENMAPIIGPMMNPTENAMPTNAMALPRFFASETSVMTAMLSDMFPLLSPPTNRASTNIKKFDENAHITYEHAMPTYSMNILGNDLVRTSQPNSQKLTKLKSIIGLRP